MQCDCEKYEYDEEVFEYKKYWIFTRKVFMGRLYKCSCCGELWVEYMTGHGWSAYYKKPPNFTFKKDSKSSEDDNLKYYWNEETKKRWSKIVSSLPRKEKFSYGNVDIPGDIMTVLIEIFKDIEKVREWLFKARIADTNFDIPIKLIKEEDGENKIRLVLLKLI